MLLHCNIWQMESSNGPSLSSAVFSCSQWVQYTNLSRAACNVQMSLWYIICHVLYNSECRLIEDWALVPTIFEIASAFYSVYRQQNVFFCFTKKLLYINLRYKRERVVQKLNGFTVLKYCFLACLLSLCKNYILLLLLLQ